MMIILGILVAIGSRLNIVWWLFYGGIDTKVTAIEVMDSIKPPVITNAPSNGLNSPTQTIENANGLPSVKLPFVLQKHFNTPEKIQTLNNWLNALVSTMGDRQEFIDEMAATVVEAEKHKLSSNEAINKYKELKFKKLELEQSTKAERRTLQLYYAGAVVGAVALIALFSLILVLLAIERNTRRTER